jgi:hypothetical protein
MEADDDVHQLPGVGVAGQVQMQLPPSTWTHIYYNKLLPGAEMQQHLKREAQDVQLYRPNALHLCQQI